MVCGFFKKTHQMKPINYVVNMSILPNQVKAQAFTLPKGFIIGANIYTNGADNNKIINASLKDDSGVAITKACSIKHWRSREGGSFEQSLLPLHFDGEGKQYQFEINDVFGLLTQELKVQVVFTYKTN